jgi:hypothetical protein
MGCIDICTLSFAKSASDFDCRARCRWPSINPRQLKAPSLLGKKVWCVREILGRRSELGEPCDPVLSQELCPDSHLPRPRETLLHARKGVSAACAQHQPCARQAVMVVSTLSELFRPRVSLTSGHQPDLLASSLFLTLMRKSIPSGVVLLVSWCPLHAESSCVV